MIKFLQILPQKKVREKALTKARKEKFSTKWGKVAQSGNFVLLLLPNKYNVWQRLLGNMNAG
jgi:hypothetical protein